MKITILLSLYFVILFAHCNSLPSAAAPPAVVDSDGDEVVTGRSYYLVSAIFGGGGGGLKLSRSGNQICPITVAQHGSDLQNGIPCSFHRADSNEGTIRVSSSVNIRFEVFLPCAKSTVWQVGNYSKSANSNLIEIGGILGNPSCDTFRNWFKIEGVGPFYWLESDPSDVCDIPIAKYNLSIFFTEEKRLEKRLLGLSNDRPFGFMIIKKDKRVDQAY